MIEQQDAASEHLALVHRLERPCYGDMLGIHHHFQIARLEFFHAAIEHDVAAVDEHHIGENVLDLFNLMRRHDDGAAAIEVVVQQRIVELLAIQDVEAECRLVQHQQSCIDGHDQGEVQLGHHALRQLPDLAAALDDGLCKKTFRLRAIEARMYAGDVIERLRNPHPARQHSDIRYEADIAHELIALRPGVASEHLQFALIRGEAENRVERGGLACAVGTDESEDVALFDAQIDAVQRDGCAEGLAQAACFYAWHDFSAPDWPLTKVRRLRQQPVVPAASGPAAEWSRGSPATVPQETFDARSAAADCARRH